jgi:hypothetical protein
MRDDYTPEMIDTDDADSARFFSPGWSGHWSGPPQPAQSINQSSSQQPLSSTN